MTDMLRWIGSGLRLDEAVRKWRVPRPRSPGRRFRRMPTARYDLLLVVGPAPAPSREILLVLARA